MEYIAAMFDVFFRCLGAKTFYLRRDKFGAPKINHCGRGEFSNTRVKNPIYNWPQH